MTEHAPFAQHVYDMLDLDKMRKALAACVGTHNFEFFRSGNSNQLW